MDPEEKARMESPSYSKALERLDEDDVVEAQVFATLAVAEAIFWAGRA